MVLEWIQLLSWAYDKTQVSLGFNHDCTVLSANLMECCGIFAVLIFKLQKSQKIRTTASSSFSKKKTIFTAYSVLNKHCKLAAKRWTGVEHSGVFLHGTIWKVIPWNFVDWCRHLKKTRWMNICLSLQQIRSMNHHHQNQLQLLKLVFHWWSTLQFLRDLNIRL